MLQGQLEDEDDDDDDDDDDYGEDEDDEDDHEGNDVNMNNYIVRGGVVAQPVGRLLDIG